MSSAKYGPLCLGLKVITQPISPPNRIVSMTACMPPDVKRTKIYRQVSNIRRTLVGNKIVDNSDVVGASPVGAIPTTSSLST